MKYPHLFSPIKIGNTVFRNRIFAAPTSMPMCNPPAYFDKDCVAVYEERAKYGCASVSLGESIVHTPTGLAHPHKIRMDDPQAVPSLSDVARAIRQYGAIPTIELAHAGKYANVANLVSKDMVSKNPAYGPDHEINANGAEILEMPEEVIETIVEYYGKAAAIAKTCGYGMIMVHAGHGWLLHQFLSAQTNHRKDKFGGSLENRMRFATMAVDAVRKAVGPGFPIEFRMSGAEFAVDGGYDIDEGIEIAKVIAPKVNLIHVSAGIHDDPFSCIITHPSMFEEHGRNVYLAEAIKKNVETPVAAIGGLNDPEMLEEIIASGKADVVEMARALLADPQLPIKAATGREDEIVKCARCFTCLGQVPTTRNIRCTVNPRVGRQVELGNEDEITPAKVSKKLLVVGGGPAGMEAAHMAALRGHDVTLVDDHDALGGWLQAEKHVPFKAELYNWAVQKEAQIIKEGVKVVYNTKVDRKWAEEFGADAIICAAGASPAAPPIPGLKLPIVKGLDDLRVPDPGFGKKVVILGGGLVGCETAVHLLHQGHEVVVVEMFPDYAKDAAVWHRLALVKELEGNADIRVNTKVKEVRENSVIVEKDGVIEEISADTVFSALGLSPRYNVRDELRGLTPYFYEIGDCTVPSNMYQASGQGHFTGLLI